MNKLGEEVLKEFNELLKRQLELQRDVNEFMRKHCIPRKLKEAKE